MSGKVLVTCLHNGIKMQRRGMVIVNKIGTRDVVGHGVNGQESYLERSDYPMPAIRFKDNTPDVLALREKEKGDWKKLSLDEKKALYRASFRQTFSEMRAPTGQWKQWISGTLACAALSLWYYLYMKAFVYPPLPESFSEEARLAQLERMLLLDVNPITGISAEYRNKN